MKKELKNLLTIGFAGLVVVVGIILSISNSGPIDQNILVRSDSYALLQGKPVTPKVTVVAFEDFQCPACGVFHAILSKIIQDNPNQIDFVFRHFPLPQHQNALMAANAAEAAGEQGKFWQMYDKLYDTQSEWSGDNNAINKFTTYAQELGLDTVKFQKAVQDQKFAQKIKRDENDSESLQLNATPSIFINGQKYEGGLSYDSLLNALKPYLTK